jgi:hypothetical protein
VLCALLASLFVAGSLRKKGGKKREKRKKKRKKRKWENFQT